MELSNLNSGSCGTSSTISLAYSNPFYSITNNMETEELWDFLWVYIGEEDEEDGEEIETFPHEGRVFGTKSDVEKSLLVEFARLYTEVDVEDYELKLRKW